MQGLPFIVYRKVSYWTVPYRQKVLEQMHKNVMYYIKQNKCLTMVWRGVMIIKWMLIIRSICWGHNTFWPQHHNLQNIQEGIAMAFDYKKEYKEFYMPKNKPEIVNIPEMNFIAVRGVGDPNEEGGAYKEAIGLLYAIAFTIKMSKKGSRQIEGYFDYVVPPLEGFWWQDGMNGFDYSKKDEFHWISVIRLPDFVTESDFAWAVEEATRKKKTDFSKVEFLTIEEGLCVQCMHIGSFDREPETIALMDQFLQENGYENDFSSKRLHHEIYLSDARRVLPEKWRTVIRHPVRRG